MDKPKIKAAPVTQPTNAELLGAPVTVTMSTNDQLAATLADLKVTAAAAASNAAVARDQCGCGCGCGRGCA